MTEQTGASIKAALNEAQWEAVSYNDGPSLVVAGAGSGKTRVLTYKIAFLLEKGVPSWKILALTFTNKAAREMKERIEKIVGMEKTPGLWAGTFHGIFAKILRKYAPMLGYDSNYTIYDASDSRSLIKKIVKELGLDDKKYKSSTVAAKISDAKNNLLLPEGYAASTELLKRDSLDGLSQVAKIYYIYMQRLQQANAMDFDDLLLNMYLLLKNNPDVCQVLRERFEYILIDEYQDTNIAQYQIIRLLAPPEAKLCVVGDDAQSIYGFRGAQIGNILNFQRDYPTTKLIKLEQNYRSTQTIVSAANSIIEHNRGRIPKTVFSKNEVGDRIVVAEAHSDREESMKVVRKIQKFLRHNEFFPNNIAVLYRTNAQSRAMEDSFRDAGVPYRVYGGQSFYQRKEIKDVVAYLRLIVNPYDEEALHRIVNYPTRGIGDTTMRKLQSAASAFGEPLWHVLSDPLKYSVNINRGTISKLQAFSSLIVRFQSEVQSRGAYDVAYDIVLESGIFAEIKSDASPENLSRQENIEEMLNGIREFETDVREEEGRDIVPVADYLARVSLLTDQDERRDGGQRVTLMTIHAAKGLEFDVVFVTGMEEDLFPNANAKSYPKDMEEERRLFYVAVTRAKKKLFLTYAKQRYQYGKMEFCQPSIFLDEVAPQYLQRDGIGTAPPSFSERASDRRSAVVSRDSVSGSRPMASPVPAVPGQKLRKLTSLTATQTSSASGAFCTTSLRVGQRVEHERFGLGTVIAIDGEDVSIRATVEFENARRKTLLLKFAKFKVIE